MVSNTVKNYTFLPAGYLAGDGQWYPELYCGEAEQLYRLTDKKGIEGSIIEGLRLTAKDVQAEMTQKEINATVRSAQIDNFRIDLSVDNWSGVFSEALTETKKANFRKRFLQTGDVIVKRIAPLRSAWVTPSIPHVPVDENCFIIRRLKQTDAFWYCLCFNQPIYNAYLTRNTRGTSLFRVSIKSLKNTEIPTPPDAVKNISSRAWTTLEKSYSESAAVFRLKHEVEQNFAAAIKEEFASETDEAHLPVRFYKPTDIGDSLLQKHVQLQYLQNRLKEEYGWVKLEDLLYSESSSRLKEADVFKNARFMRLADIGNDFTTSEPDPEFRPQNLFRSYSQPLAEGDVLLSTLVTAPRAAFIGESPRGTVYISDTIERLVFRETPGAWALILNTKPIQRQLSLMSVGTVQQFTNSAFIRKLLVPPVSREYREKIDERLRLFYRQKKETERDWNEIMKEAQEIFEWRHRQG